MTDSEKIIAMFKQAFGEEEYEKLVEAATQEIVSELSKEAAPEDVKKHEWYVEGGTINQGKPTVKQQVENAAENLKNTVTTGAQDFAKQVKENFSVDVDIKPGAPESNYGREVRVPYVSPAESNYGMEANPPSKYNAGHYGANAKPGPVTEKEKFEGKLEDTVKNVRETVQDAVPKGEEVAERGYEIAGDVLDAANANPGAAAAVAGGAGAAGLAGLGLLGKGVAKAIKKKKVPKEVVASINEEIMEELIKES